ncbi:alpha/beta hydrolase [bacterium]|nr:alpha/beta hydrolase [bacterium]
MSTPYVRRSGSGPAVVCLHSSTGSSKQWTLLTEHLSQRYEVLSPDLYGYGQSPAWSEKRILSLDDEIALLRPVLDSISGPFHVIGHSYGAAVAFKLALTVPNRVRSVTVFEPVLFNLIFSLKETQVAAKEIWAVRDDVRALVHAGETERAALRFIDYWSGPGVWDSLPSWQRQAIAKRMVKVVSDFDATFGNPTPLEAYRELDIPTLFLYGLESPTATQEIAQWLGGHLPRAEVRGLLGMGHMGPVTHAEQIANIVVRFVEKQPKGILVHQIRRTLKRQVAS